MLRPERLALRRTGPSAGSRAERPVIVMTHDYPPLTGGGLALGVRELAGLLGSGHEVRVLTSRLVDHAADDRRRAAPDEPGIGYERASALGAARAMHRADVVIAHVTFSFRWLAVLSLVLGPLLDKPTVCVLHTAPDHCDYNRLRHLPSFARAAVFALARRALRGCAAVVALGPAHAAAIVAAGLPVTHIAPLPVAPPERYREAFRQHAANLGPVGVIGFAGELSPLKGADTLPGLLRELTPHYRFLIAGAGPLAGRLTCCAAALSPVQCSRVVLAGPVPPGAMPWFYRQVDCLLVLSRSEAHCRVILEAMLAGVIVLAAPTCGSADLVTPGATGLLIRPDDPASVGAVLAALAADPARARLIREHAAAFAGRLAADSRSAWHELLRQLTGCAERPGRHCGRGKNPADALGRR